MCIRDSFKQIAGRRTRSLAELQHTSCVNWATSWIQQDTGDGNASTELVVAASMVGVWTVRAVVPGNFAHACLQHIPCEAQVAIRTGQHVLAVR